MVFRPVFEGAARKEPDCCVLKMSSEADGACESAASRAYLLTAFVSQTQIHAPCFAYYGLMAPAFIRFRITSP